MKHASLYFLLLLASNALANNVRITNVSTIPSATFTQVAFDISWDNSWRVSSGPSNYDAVWVFIKYKVGNVWVHLDMTGANNSIGGGFTINVPSDSKGCFIYRSADGSGNVTLTDVRVGVPVTSGSFDIKVFGIEMAYIPQGNFYLGDGNGTTETANSFHSGVTNSSVQITSSLVSDIRVDVNANDDAQIEATGIGIDGDGGLDTDDNGAVDNAFFPTGYLSFFCMKYELSQGAYRDFLNTLTYNQQTTCTDPSFGGVPPNSATGTEVMSGSTYRVYMEIKTPGVDNTMPAIYGLDANSNNIFDEAADGEWIACGGLSWKYMCSYLDWAALRPMTELEFEKACRGTPTPVTGERAWGTTTINLTPYILANAAQNSETITNASASVGNAIHDGAYPNPVRNGIFATSTSGRTQAGATYYGLMEMSGNLDERPVSVGNVAGRSFRGTLGNGTLNAAGTADVDYWPGINGNSNATIANTTYGGVTGATVDAGSGTRGGSFTASSGVQEMRVSDRQDAAASGFNSANSHFGCRGVR